MTKLVYSKNLMRKEFVHFVAPLFIATSSTHFLYFVAFPSSYCNNSKFCGTMNTFFALNWIAYNLWLNWFTIRIWWEKKKFISYHLCWMEQMSHFLYYCICFFPLQQLWIVWIKLWAFQFRVLGKFWVDLI